MCFTESEWKFLNDKHYFWSVFSGIWTAKSIDWYNIKTFLKTHPKVIRDSLDFLIKCAREVDKDTLDSHVWRN